MARFLGTLGKESANALKLAVYVAALVMKPLEEIADEVEEVLDKTFDLYKLPATSVIDRAVILTADASYACDYMYTPEE